LTIAGIETLTDRPTVTRRLAQCGLGEQSASATAEQFARAAGVLLSEGIDPGAGAIALYVPGRIEVLGKHTDYCGGHSLIAAAGRGICFVGVPREDRTIHAFAPDLQGSSGFELSAEITPAAGHWSNYPMTVARRLARNFPGQLRGATVAYCGDLPPDAGLSSSSAVLTGMFLMLSQINDLPSRRDYGDSIAGPEALGAYLGAVENGSSFGSLAGDSGVGTFGGSEDHTAILNARAGRLSRYSYCPVHLHETIALGDGWTFAIASSGVSAPKTGHAKDTYNRISRRASAVLQLWREQTGRDDPHLAAAVASEPEAVDRMRTVLSQSADCDGLTADELLARFDQFHAENCEIIPAACEALSGGDLAEFGRQVARSQELAENLLGNQVPQTVSLARGASQLGAAAASAFGAGFGGAVWALVRSDSAGAFLDRWRDAYCRAFATESKAASFFITRPGPAAFFLQASVSRGNEV